MNFLEAIKSCFRNYFNFSGRARRSEFWYWVLFTFLVSTLISIALNDSAATNAIMQRYASDPAAMLKAMYAQPAYIVSAIWGLFTLIPSYSVWARRLHDIGKSGKHIIWLCLICIIPLIGMLVMAIFFIMWGVRDSEYAENKWGPCLKSPEEEL